MASDTAYVSFSAEINQTTSETLLALCAQLTNQGTKAIYLLMSTPGGGVLQGINVYNVLRALPVHLITHNTGAVNSIGNPIFLAGEERYANPRATFMFHGVGFDIQNTRLEQKNLRELLDSAIADEAKIGAIIADRTTLSREEVAKLFLEAVTRDPNYAKANGIIHDIREAKIPDGCPVHQLVFKR